ncbi:NFU domain protein 1 [Wolffia australiana]
MAALMAELLCSRTPPAINPLPDRRHPSSRSFSLKRLSIVHGDLISNSRNRFLPVRSASYSSPSPLELTVGNVDLVLEEVRPYLIADGGNVEVVSADDGIVTLRLQGACGSCPSSTTTMTMGIERVLKEKFGESVREIRQAADESPALTTVEAVNRHLDMLRPAIKNYGGSVEVVSIDGAECRVSYVGPESIGSGIKAAIKERFSDIQTIVFVASG